MSIVRIDSRRGVRQWSDADLRFVRQVTAQQAGRRHQYGNGKAASLLLAVYTQVANEMREREEDQDERL